MKQVFRAADGTFFENEGDCLKYEFELNDGNGQFKAMVKEAIKEAEAATGLTFELIKADAKVDWDGDPNNDSWKYVVWQSLIIKAFENGVQRGDTHTRGSDGRFTKESLRDELIETYYLPYKKEHEGIIEDSDRGEWYAEGYAINGVEVNEILRANYGKRVRIEIIE